MTLQQQLSELKDKLAELERKLEKVPEIIIGDCISGGHPTSPYYKKEWPQEGDRYWYVDCDGKVVNAPFEDCDFDKNCLSSGNAFQSKLEAKRALLRRQAAYKKWLPKFKEKYYFIGFLLEDFNNTHWENSDECFSNYHLGNTHKTEEDAQAWWEKYKEGFMIGGE